MSEQVVSGWGRAQWSRATVVVVATPDQVADAVTSAGPRGVLARGLGRSYGDASNNAGGTVLDLSRMNAVDVRDDGVVSVGAGATLAEVIDALLARGKFVPVTPGTARVTLGGAVASDVHGKNHHVDGSLGRHVESLDLVIGDGTMRTVGPESQGADRDLFLATTGGMGLTGVVTGVRLRTIEVPGPWMSVDTRRHDHLDALMTAMTDADAHHRYSVAWVDSTSRGRSLGRGVLTCGDHVAGGASLRAVASPPRVRVPFVPPVRALTSWSIARFNDAWFRRAPRRRDGDVQSVAAYFHPLDGIGGWNRLYGPRGLVQYQIAVPDSGAGVVAHVLERLQAAGAPSFVSVLKRFGPGSEAPLSFPLAGWTLAVDLPADVAGLGAALDALDADVVRAGGRVYLAKDSRTTPSTLAAMYPLLPRWRDTVRSVDPDRVFRSDLARRLSL